MESSIGKVRPLPIIAIIFAILVVRKLWIAHNAMGIVASCHEQVTMEKIISDESFRQVVRSMSNTEPTLIFIFNKHALNMTKNWLCNTQNMNGALIGGVHERSLAVTLDRESYDAIGLLWPNIARLYFDVPCLKMKFNYGDGYYHLFFLLRSNVARAFLSFHKPIWMIHQDAFWLKSILEMQLNEKQNEADIIFDKISDTKMPLIGGGYFLVKPTCGSRAFFEQLSADLSSRYVPDNTHMTSLCSSLASTRCESFDFQDIATWIWFMRPVNESSSVPYSLHFDGETKLGGKLATMRKLGFYFLNDDMTTCNATAVSAAIDSVMTRKIDVSLLRSSSRLQFEFYQTFLDYFFHLPISETILNRIFFPYALYFMITI